MKIEQKLYTEDKGWRNFSGSGLKKAQLVLAFGSTGIIKDKKHYQKIRSFYPLANVVMCSTAGEILNTNVNDETISLTAIYFEKTKLKFASTINLDPKKSYESGKKLMKTLPKENLSHIMVFSDGLKINGSYLTQGLHDGLPEGVAATGGLVGDGSHFKETLVGLNEVPKSSRIVVIGFYGKNIKVGYGSLGGWDTFGPDRMITRSKDNILYELDNQPALKLYKEYLGKQAAGLPGTGLLFPLYLKLTTKEGKVNVVRTILAVNEKDQSMTFAGNMPQGCYAQLMKANFERLIDGAGGAAKLCRFSKSPDLAILISCIGRKLVLKDRIEEEVEAVRDVLGQKTALAGFYSYGEISPIKPVDPKCSLHNQTMTITTFSE